MWASGTRWRCRSQTTLSMPALLALVCGMSRMLARPSLRWPGCRPGGRVVCLEIASPQIIGFKQFYNLWFDEVVPLLGRVTSRNDFAYSYLPASVRRFGDPDMLREVMQDVGLINCRYEILAGGIITLHHATA